MKVRQRPGTGPRVRHNQDSARSLLGLNGAAKQSVKTRCLRTAFTKFRAYRPPCRRPHRLPLPTELAETIATWCPMREGWWAYAVVLAATQPERPAPARPHSLKSWRDRAADHRDDLGRPGVLSGSGQCVARESSGAGLGPRQAFRPRRASGQRASGGLTVQRSASSASVGGGSGSGVGLAV